MIAATVWDFARLADLADLVESTIATLGGPDDLRPAYDAARAADDLHTRRAWANVGPAAALRMWGDCWQVNELGALAAADLADLIEPE